MGSNGNWQVVPFYEWRLYDCFQIKPMAKSSLKTEKLKKTKVLSSKFIFAPKELIFLHLNQGGQHTPSISPSHCSLCIC
jgi:hypothetical protein